MVFLFCFFEFAFSFDFENVKKIVKQLKGARVLRFLNPAPLLGLQGGFAAETAIVVAAETAIVKSVLLLPLLGRGRKSLQDHQHLIDNGIRGWCWPR